MSIERQQRQAAIVRKLHTAIAEFCIETKKLIEEDPHDPMTKQMVAMHNSQSISFFQSLQSMLKGAGRNFLRVIKNENDPL